MIRSVYGNLSDGSDIYKDKSGYYTFKYNPTTNVDKKDYLSTKKLNKLHLQKVVIPRSKKQARTKGKKKKGSAKGKKKKGSTKGNKKKGSTKGKASAKKRKGTGPSSRSRANQVIIDKVKLAKKLKEEAEAIVKKALDEAAWEAAKQKLKKWPFSTPPQEDIERQLEQDRQQQLAINADLHHSVLVPMPIEIENERAAEEETAARQAAAAATAAAEVKAREEELKAREEEVKAMSAATEEARLLKKVDQTLRVAAETARQRTALERQMRTQYEEKKRRNAEFRSAGAAGGPAQPTQPHIIDILSNKLSTPSKTGCYEIKNTVWKNANIPFGSTRKLTRKCINKLIDIISRNLRYFPVGLFDGNAGVRELLASAITNAPCLPCKDGHDAGGDDIENLLADPDLSAPTGIATPNKNKSKSKKKSTSLAPA